ncbi:hypothetical protein [Vreelandella sp. GE22]
MRNIEAIIKDIEEYAPVNDEWESLDELIDEACNANDRRVFKPLLGLFERNQDHDGYGVFWSIVHGLEGLGGYETELAASVLSKPHEMSVLMLNRMLNGGIQAIDGRPVLEILKEIATNTAFPNSLREDAKRFVAYQQENM